MTPSFVRRLPSNPTLVTQYRLSLTADERTRSCHYFETEDGQGLYLRLPRGTMLQHGDLLESETGALVRIEAKPEPVMTITATTPLNLLKAAYHLGNRHVPLEVTETYLRLSPDSVLKAMLEQLGLAVQEEVVPFKPEAGAYGHHMRHSQEGNHHA